MSDERCPACGGTLAYEGIKEGRMQLRCAKCGFAYELKATVLFNVVRKVSK